jgi:hypothetical protein
MSLKIENSRRVAKSRPVCMDLNSEFLKKTFRYSGAMQWNHLSEDSKNSETLSSFKRKIRRQA